MRKRLFLVVNPCSGTKKIKPALLQVVQIFSGAGFEVTVYPTKCRGDATRVVESLPAGYDTIVCSGGDGTLNEVITGMLNGGIKCRLGYLPAGTLNEWSSGLSISRNLLKAAEDIVSGADMPLDIGQFGDRYFSYTASFGAFTEASYSAPQDIKNILGQAAYFFEGIKGLGNIKPRRLSITLENGQTYEDEFIFGAVSNSMSVGGILKFKETLVSLNDGLFEIVLVRKPKNIAQLQHIVSSLLKQSFDNECILFTHASSLQVSGGADMSWTLDGEQANGSETVQISILHSALQFIIPQKRAKKFLSEDQSHHETARTGYTK